MVWWLIYLIVISSPVWLFFLLDLVRQRRSRPRPEVLKAVRLRGPAPRLYVRGAALEAQFLVAPHRAIIETTELLGSKTQSAIQEVQSPEELRRSFEELISRVRR